MINLADFEGVSGFKWGALMGPEGTVEYCGKAPRQPDKKLGLIPKLLTQVPFQIGSASFRFQMGKVLLRRGFYGCLFLVCDEEINVSLIDIVLAEVTQQEGAPGRNSLGESASLDSKLSMIHTVDLETRPVPQGVVERLLDLYTEYLGPLARKLAAKDARGAGLKLDELPSNRWPNLLNTLASRFDQEHKREAFLDQAILLKNEF